MTSREQPHVELKAIRMAELRAEEAAFERHPLTRLCRAIGTIVRWLRRPFIATLAVGLIAGCIMPMPEDPVDPDRPIKRAAVVAGLTAVDPRAYGGWHGDCPGCDVDAELFALLCRERGLTVAELHNSQATIDGTIAAARAAWRGLQSGDLFVLYVSGHGGQIPDGDGDEIDRLDETLCLWDGELSDDVLRTLWEEMPAGVRVLFVTDTCNSGTNYRYRPRSIRPTIPRSYSGSLIHYGGCADGYSSFGSEQGGVWTTALLDTWTPTQTYRSWFQSAALLMPSNQTPYYAEYGHVAEAFRSTCVFQ